MQSSVGAEGFEPSTSRSRTVRASRAALRPERTHYTLALMESKLDISLMIN